MISAISAAVYFLHLALRGTAGASSFLRALREQGHEKVGVQSCLVHSVERVISLVTHSLPRCFPVRPATHTAHSNGWFCFGFR